MASSAAGTMTGVTRPMARTLPATGTKTVASPRSCWNSSLAYTPPLGPVACRPCARTVACSSPRAPCHHGRMSGWLTTAVMPAARTAGTLRCSITGASRGGCSRLRSDSTAALVCGEFGLEPAEMRGDEGIAGRGVGRVKDRLDLADRHLQVPQAADYLRGRYLCGGVVAVARAGVHGGRFQQADLVVVPERLDAQVRNAGKVTDCEPCCHLVIVNPPLTGQSTEERGLDPPAEGAPRVES